MLRVRKRMGVWLSGGSTSLSTVGILGQIVTFVGAGEGRSGVGTQPHPGDDEGSVALASPMVGRCEAAGEQDAGRPKGPVFYPQFSSE